MNLTAPNKPCNFTARSTNYFTMRKTLIFTLVFMPILNCVSEITGHWEFNSSLNATIGQNLEWAWEQGDASFDSTGNFGISDINGKPANVLKFADSDDLSEFS